MTSAQPPSNGDGPVSGQEAASEAAGSPEIPTPPAPKRTPSRRAPAAKKLEDAENPVKRTPSARKRSTATSPISPNGEAPEILDAMLGKPAKAPVESAPEPPETATAVLPSASDYYREQTAETEVLAPAPAEPAVDAQRPADEVSVPEAEAPAVAAAVGEEAAGATPPTDTVPPTEPSPPSDAAEPDATEPEGAAPQGAAPEGAAGARHGRSVNELADRLDDSRFFSSLFDFTFTSYVTRKLAGPVYVVGLVLIGLGIVVGFANSLGIAIATNSPGGAFVFLLGVLVTLVAAILAVLLLRVTIEVFCAIIEIAQNTRRRRPPRD